MRNLYAMLGVIAPSPLSVLILGETGVGKELYAAAVHARSTRAGAAFLQLNCAALAESILEAELFGYERGAFTGAVQAKPGLFESADGGTVFLDEVADLPASTQAKLLRVLESGDVIRLGSVKPKHVDVRFVAATNGDPRRLVADGKFRADLYFRLNGITITIPPLRSRRADIAPIARRIAERASATVGKRSLELTPSALRALEDYSWPGNVRELKNVVERAVVLCDQEELGVDQLVMADPDAFAQDPPRSASPKALKEELKSIEKRRILSALEATAGNQSEAARVLKMSRYTLMSRIEEYGLARPRKGR
jgi:two-component system response regulator AtoC